MKLRGGFGLFVVLILNSGADCEYVKIIFKKCGIKWDNVVKNIYLYAE